MDRLHAAVVIRRHGNAIAFSVLRNHPVPFWKRTGLKIVTSFCQRNVAVHRSHLSNGDSDDVAVIHGGTMRTTHRTRMECDHHSRQCHRLCPSLRATRFSVTRVDLFWIDWHFYLFTFDCLCIDPTTCASGLIDVPRCAAHSIN